MNVLQSSIFVKHFAVQCPLHGNSDMHNVLRLSIDISVLTNNLVFFKLDELLCMEGLR